MDVKNIETELSKFIYELETEDRFVWGGLKKQINKTGNAKTREILQRIYFTIAGSFIGLKTAVLDDSIKTYFSQAKVKVRNEELAYFQISPKIAKEPVFDQRELYSDAIDYVITKISPKQLELLNTEVKLIQNLGYGNYLAFYAKAKKMDYANFNKIADKIKKETDNLWQRTIEKVSKEILGRSFKNLRS